MKKSLLVANLVLLASFSTASFSAERVVVEDTTPPSAAGPLALKNINLPAAAMPKTTSPLPPAASSGPTMTNPTETTALPTE